MPAPRRCGPVRETGPGCLWRAGPALRAAAGLALAAVLGTTARPGAAAEYQDPQGRFSLALPDGFVEVPRPVLGARLEALRRAGTRVPAYQAAFDRGGEPRLSYPYALLEVVPVPGAAWTTADLQEVLGRMETEPAARDAAAALDRLGLGNLLRDPRITFLRWEPDRQAGAYRLRTRAQGAEISGEGRIYFYREGYVALWFYYLAGSPYAQTAGRLTAALAVRPEHRVPPPARDGVPWLVGLVGVGAAAGGLWIWLVVGRRRRPAGG